VLICGKELAGTHHRKGKCVGGEAPIMSVEEKVSWGAEGEEGGVSTSRVSHIAP